MFCRGKQVNHNELDMTLGEYGVEAEDGSIR